MYGSPHVFVTGPEPETGEEFGHTTDEYLDKRNLPRNP